MSKEQNILIVGGAGYVGSETTRYLQQQGFKVFVIDNLSTGNAKSLPNTIPLYKGDIGDIIFLEQVIKKERPTAVIHFAASIEVGASSESPLCFYHNNVAKTIGLLKIMEKYGINKFIFSSTAAVYGESPALPLKENSHKEPVSIYGHTKLMVENMLQQIATASNLNYAILRYFNASGASLCGHYGESRRSLSHLIPLAIKTAQGKRKKMYIFGDNYSTTDGTCIRDYVHINDLAIAHYLVLNKLILNRDNYVYNVGSGKGFSVKEIINIVQKISRQNFKVEICNARHGDPAVLVADTTKIYKELCWKPSLSIYNIIETAWQWHETYPNGY